MQSQKSSPSISIFTFFLVVIPLGMLWSGFVESLLWSWFIVPKFGLPSLSVLEAIGVSIMLSAFFSGNVLKNQDDDITGEKLWNAMLQIAVVPLIFLIMGFVLSLFI